jgi:hypothetical protein
MPHVSHWASLSEHWSLGPVLGDSVTDTSGSGYGGSQALDLVNSLRHGMDTC